MKDYCKLIRWPNLLMVGIVLFVMEKEVACSLLNQVRIGEVMPWWVLTLLIIATLCVTAAGYVINDYFDIKIDLINRPERVIVSRSVSKDSAMHLFYILSAVGMVMGIGISIWAHSWTVAMMYMVVPGLLWFYSAGYKRQLLVGNMVVAFACGLAPLLVAFANVDRLRYIYGSSLVYTPITGSLFTWLGGFAIFAFVLTLAREVVKDMEDVEGDRELECHTIPVVWGFTAGKSIATGLLLLVMGGIAWLWYSVLPFEHVWTDWGTHYIVCTLIIPLAGAIALIWAAKIPRDFRHAQWLIKWVMFMGVMFGFFV